MIFGSWSFATRKTTFARTCAKRREWRRGRSLSSFQATLVASAASNRKKFDSALASSHQTCIYNYVFALDLVSRVSQLCLFRLAPRHQGCDTALREAFPRQRTSRDSIHGSDDARADGTALHLRVVGETRSRAYNPLAKLAFDRKQRLGLCTRPRRSTRPKDGTYSQG